MSYNILSTHSKYSRA